MTPSDMKKAVDTIVSRRSPKGEKLSGPAEMKDEKSLTSPGEEDGRHAAAQDVLGALNDKSPQKLLEALGNFFDLHQSHRSKEASPEEPEE